jgi:hypothetical protein
MSDCARFLGEPFEDVNRWMDALFAEYGPSHRRFRHHREGVEEARVLFGSPGASAAAIHILRDCRHIPRKQDYELGYVDVLGLKTNWSTAAYIKYSQGDFESLVEQLLQPSGLVLWSFVDPNILPLLLNSMTHLAPAEIQELMTQWPKAAAKKNSMPPLAADEGALISPETASPAVLDYLKEIEASQLFAALSSTQKVSFGLVKLDGLVNPLACLDYEYLNSLKPELPGTDDIQVARFALPQTLAMQVKAVADPTQRSVMFLSNEKALTVLPMQISQTPQGTEVKFVVASSLSLLLVANHSGRLIIRNGIHRAFLLAKMGVKVAPCIVVEETGPLPNVHLSSYPSFAPPVLVQPRPPLLFDFFDQDLCLQVPLQRTHKLIRISAEEAIIPID